MKKAEKIARKQFLEIEIEEVKKQIQRCLAEDHLMNEEVPSPYGGTLKGFTWRDKLRVDRKNLAELTSELEKINKSLSPRTSKGSVYDSDKSVLDTIRVEGYVSGVRL